MITFTTGKIFQVIKRTSQWRAYLLKGCQIRLIPSNYKNVDVNDGYQWASTAMELPTVSWNSDYYLNWQAKNGLQSGFKATEKYASTIWRPVKLLHKMPQ